MDANVFIWKLYLSFTVTTATEARKTFIYKFLTRDFFTEDRYLIFQYTFLPFIK